MATTVSACPAAIGPIARSASATRPDRRLIAEAALLFSFFFALFAAELGVNCAAAPWPLGCAAVAGGR